MTPRLLLPLATALTLAAPVLAQDGRAFERIDSNSDGQISRAEIDALRGTVFDLMDSNGNGSLTRAEVEDAQAAAEGRMKQGARRLWRSDANGDGAVTRVEFLAQ
ncbi:EF-hand domain-containing protein [Oceanicola sp. D3]|uniref:EF-hand domain-containing protein n=1 Tax=Oceanicola sp. D3 TaxID=2587163 RepID=UPI00111EF72F|nr:EF-hand domain-containing protein [Oceanicola sp. D3]QDC09285.1 EF-hand domain-containing protein [Oceanicola sp. D3]